jgi:hypothetical protein
MEETKSQINRNLAYATFNTTLYFVVSRDADITEEDKTQQEAEARKLASEFVFLLNNNKYVTVENSGFNVIFREGGYLGMGIAGVLPISLADRNDFCDIFCNTSTNDVEC